MLHVFTNHSDVPILGNRDLQNRENNDIKKMLCVCVCVCLCFSRLNEYILVTLNHIALYSTLKIENLN